MMDGLNEKLRFTIEEASELGLGSVRQIRYMIKRGDIQCIPPWVDGKVLVCGYTRWLVVYLA